MRASDLQTHLSLVKRDTTAVEAARLIARDHLAGLVVADDEGVPSAVLSAVDVLGLLVPGYMLDDMSLAGVLDERGAEEVWSGAGEHVVGELLDDDGVQVHDILKVDADATLVEIAALMAQARAQIALVRGAAGSEYGFLLLPAVMEAILRFCGPSGSASSE